MRRLHRADSALEPVVPEPQHFKLTVTYNPYDGSDEEKTLECVTPSVLQVHPPPSAMLSEPQTSTQAINQNETLLPIPTLIPPICEDLHVNNELLIFVSDGPVDANVLKQLERRPPTSAVISKGGTFTLNRQETADRSG